MTPETSVVGVVRFGVGILILEISWGCLNVQSRLAAVANPAVNKTKLDHKTQGRQEGKDRPMRPRGRLVHTLVSPPLL